MIPTIEQVMKYYGEVALSERMKTGRPGPDTVANVLRGTSAVCRAARIDCREPVTALTRRKIDAALATFLNGGLQRISAWSYVCQLRGLFARWCVPYYKDAGWEIPPLEVPAFRAQAPRYVRPSAEQLVKVKAWYARLTGAPWFAATMMLELAMRNGDVLRLKESNFVTKELEVGGRTLVRHFLSYTPHKTELTSGRQVFWPIHDDIWSVFCAGGGLDALAATDETFDELNGGLRALGFSGSKASYELRKICIDHIYQKFGAEMAVSISGDDIRTICRYYADPSQPNLGAMRVIDLL